MKQINIESTRTLKAKLLATTVLASALSAACAPGFETVTALTCMNGQSCSATNGSLSGGGTNGGSTSGDWSAISMEGSINGGRFDRTKVVDIDKTAKTLVVRLPFIAGVQIGIEAPLPIKEIPGATIGIEPNTDGSSALVLRLPLAKVLRGVDFLQPGRLPNGDPLPAIAAGELPSLGLSLSRWADLKGALYLSPTDVGLFVNTKFDPTIRLTMPIRDQARTKTYGYFTSIPAKPGFDGGFFISIALPDDLARAIDDLL
jgi:hypothetical protein